MFRKILSCYYATMTEKIAKKVGEAYAFATVLHTTFTNNTKVMEELLGDHAGTVLDTTSKQLADLKNIAEATNTTDTILPKAEKTGVKITGMGETYVGDDWDDVAEVLEWMSFFVGGAIVHWQLIAGAAKEMNHEEFISVAETGAAYYAELMTQLRTYAEVVGKERAQA